MIDWSTMGTEDCGGYNGKGSAPANDEGELQSTFEVVVRVRRFLGRAHIYIESPHFPPYTEISTHGAGRCIRPLFSYSTGPICSVVAPPPLSSPPLGGVGGGCGGRGRSGIHGVVV